MKDYQGKTDRQIKYSEEMTSTAWFFILFIILLEMLSR